MSRHKITLELHKATDEQLQSALDDARESGRCCDAQGSWGHEWHDRAAAIEGVLAVRRQREGAVQ